MPATICERCDTEYAEQRRVSAERERMERLAACGAISPHLPDQTFNSSDSDCEALNREAWASAREWQPFSGESVFLSGSPGVGKSFCARCLLNAAFAAGRSIMEIQTRRLAKQVQRFDEGDLAERCAFAGVLMLDDLDKARWTEDALTGLWEVLDDRRNASKPTIVTSNMAGGELRAHLAAGAGNNHSLVNAALDRLLPVRVLTFSGESLRGNRSGR